MRQPRAAFARAAASAAALAFATVMMAGCATLPEEASASEPADIAIEGTRIFPESVTSDAAGNIYVGSNGGTIYRALAGSTEAKPWIVPDESNGLLSLFGVFADDMHGVVWTCSNPNPFVKPAPVGVSALKAFDMKTGALAGSYDLPGEGPLACNDIAVAPDGTVYASETAKGGIYALAPGADSLTTYAQGPELVGIDGLAFDDDGTLYINNVRQNLFQRVERKADGSYAGLKTIALDDTLNGPDGLRAMGGGLFLQAEGPAGRVAYIALDDENGDAAKVVTIKTGLGSSAGVTWVGNTGYATDGKINYLFDPALRDKDPGAFAIRAFKLPEEP